MENQIQNQQGDETQDQQENDEVEKLRRELKDN